MRTVLAAVRRLLAHAARDEGQTVLIAVAVIAGIALTATAVFLNLSGGQRFVERIKTGNAHQGEALPAIIAYYYQHSSLPCPDTKASPNGIKSTSCDGTSTSNAGVLPWQTLGLSRDTAIDAYGNYFTYVVSTDANNFCESITSNYSAIVETTGTIKPSSLKVKNAAGTSSSVPFAIIGHGANGLGARTAGNTGTSQPLSTNEIQNCDPVSCASGANAQSLNMGQVAGKPLISAPFSGSTGTSAFDDQVYAPSTTLLQKVCQSLTPGGALNASMTSSFSPVSAANQLTNNQGVNTGLDKNKFSAASNGVSVATDVNDTGNQVASFSGGGPPGAILVTATSYDFDPRTRPLYISTVWTPDPDKGSTATGLSIVTRATPQDQSANSYNNPSSSFEADDFAANGKHGITFRFYTDTYTSSTNTGTNITAGGTSNYISIRDNGACVAMSGGSCTTPNVSGEYKLYLGKSYLVEAYDDGQYVWARITQTDDYSNSVTVGPYNTTSDTVATAALKGQNQVAFVGGVGLNYIDNLTIGYGMLAAETGGSNSGYISGSNLHATGDLSLEAWVNPRVLPAGTASAAIMGSWDPSVGSPASPSATNSFLLSVTRSEIQLQLSGLDSSNATVNENYTAGYTPTVGQWDHIAAVYDSAKATVTFYVNGEQVGSTLSSKLSSSGVGGNNSYSFLVGATRCATSGAACSPATIGNFFNGDISDVRVWNKVLQPDDILSDYNQRLSYSVVTGAGISKLLLNWKLDRESRDVALTAALSTGTTIQESGNNFCCQTGTLTGVSTPASYVASLANYYRPFAGSADGTMLHDAAGNPLTSVCPTTTSVAKSYECDFRSASDSFTNGSMTFPANLYSMYGKVWGGGGGGFSTTLITGVGCSAGGVSDTCASLGGGGGYSAGLLMQINSTFLSGKTLDIVVGGGGGGSTTYAAGTSSPLASGYGNGAGGGGASAVILHDVSKPGLVAGGGGGASFSDNLKFPSTTGCYSLINDPGAQCGLGGAGGGVSAVTAQAADDASFICGGRGAADSPTSGSNPPDSPYCAAGGGAPSNTTGGGGIGATAGGAGGSSAVGAGGNGYKVIASAQGGVGGGGGGGGVDGSGAGGGEAGAYEVFSYDTAVIGGTVTSGDTLSITFTNASVTGWPASGSYTVLSTDTSTAKVAVGLKNAINSTISLANAGVSATCADATCSNSTITIYQLGQVAMATTLSTSTAATENVVLGNSGNFGGNANLGTDTITIGGTVHLGDTLKFVFSNMHIAQPFLTSSYTVTAADVIGGTTVLAADIALKITTDALPLILADGVTITAAAVGNVITVTQANGHANNTTLSFNSPTETITFGSDPQMIPHDASAAGATAAAAASNGYGGGGGSGFADASASNTWGQTGTSVATVAVTPGSVGDTIEINFTNSSLGLAAHPVSTTLTTSDNASTIAERLASIISADTTLSTDGISAIAVNGVINIYQQAYYGLSTTLTSTGTTAGTVVSFGYNTNCTSNNFASYYLASGCAGAFTDFYYSPSTYTRNFTNTAAGKGGAAGGNGSDGTVVLLW